MRFFPCAPALLLALTVLSACMVGREGTPTIPDGPDPTLSRDEDDAPPVPLRRGGQPIRYAVNGDMAAKAQWRDRIEARIEALSELSGVPAGRAETAASLVVAVGGAGEIRRWIDEFEHWFGFRPDMPVDCGTATNAGGVGRVVVTLVFIRTDIPRDRIEACIDRELLQVLGLPNGIAPARPDFETADAASRRLREAVLDVVSVMFDGSRASWKPHLSRLLLIESDLSVLGSSLPPAGTNPSDPIPRQCWHDLEVGIAETRMATAMIATALEAYLGTGERTFAIIMKQEARRLEGPVSDCRTARPPE